MTSGHGPQLPPNISNALIANSTITNVNGNAYFNASEHPELVLLRSKVAVAALHNSGERHNVPQCHPGTRLSIQQDIMKWLDDVDDPQLVFWMYGSAGVGKSAIAQAIASICYDSEPRRLAGAFFLSRSAPAESGRGDEKRLVATLAYQMAENIPNLEVHVADAVSRNKLVFNLDLETQIKVLILNPLAALSNEMLNRTPPMIFILDALDECSPISSQARIVNAFVAAIGKMQHNIPHKFFIASRLESHIKSVFAALEISPVVRSVSLNDNYKAWDDIQKFLVDHLKRFRETHFTPTIFPSIWPTERDIEELVQRSSGHFIYASTALKYVQEDYGNPILRLKSILDVTKYPTNQPFAELDALYSHIFRQVKELETVLYIIFAVTIDFPPLATIPFCESLLNLPKGGGALALQGLSSVLKVENDSFEAYHASLIDFLKDRHRAGDFYIYSDEICTHLCRLALGHIPPLFCCDEPDTAALQLSFCFSIATECTRRIEGAHSEIHKILSTFDLDMFFEFLKKSQGRKDYYYLYLCSHLFEWLVKEHQNLAHSKNTILLRPFSQLQKWTLGQLKRFQFDKFTSRQSLDYWDNIFLTFNGEMYLIQRGLVPFASWVVGTVSQALTEDRITQLMSQYCYYILNSSWLNVIHNARLYLKSDILSEQREFGLHLWAGLFRWNGPLQIDQYLDIQYILSLNSSIDTAESLKDSIELPYQGVISFLITDLYEYLLKVEKKFSCLTSPLNELEESTTVAEEKAVNRESSLPYIPHPSDSPSFALALSFRSIRHIEYRDTELGLPVV